MFTDGVNLKKGAWHWWLQEFTFGRVPFKNNFCPYFWLTLLCLILFPILGPIKLAIFTLIRLFTIFAAVVDRVLNLIEDIICKPFFNWSVGNSSNREIFDMWSYSMSRAREIFIARKTQHNQERLEWYEEEQQRIKDSLQKALDAKPTLKGKGQASTAFNYVYEVWSERFEELISEIKEYEDDMDSLDEEDREAYYELLIDRKFHLADKPTIQNKQENFDAYFEWWEEVVQSWETSLEVQSHEKPVLEDPVDKWSWMNYNERVRWISRNLGSEWSNFAKMDKRWSAWRAQNGDWETQLAGFRKRAAERAEALAKQEELSWEAKAKSEQKRQAVFLKLIKVTKFILPFIIGGVVLAIGSLLYVTGSAIYHSEWLYAIVGWIVDKAPVVGIILAAIFLCFLLTYSVSTFFGYLKNKCDLTVFFKSKIGRVISSPFRLIGSGIGRVGGGFGGVFGFFFEFIKAYKENNCPAINWDDNK